jgi:hypothetical protein
MFALITTFLGMIPGLSSMVTGITNAWFNSKVQITTAKIGGDVAVATELVKASAKMEHERTTQLSVFAGSKVLSVILIGFATPLIIYEWVIIIHDIVLGYGSHDPIRGQVADWGNTIIAFLFGSATIQSLGTMWFNRKNQ